MTDNSESGIQKWRGRPGGVALIAAVALGVLWATPSPTAQQDIGIEIRSGTGSGVVFAVPDFVPATPDLKDLGATLGQVLWDDLNFEREFKMLPRDVSATVARINPGGQPVFPSWRELGVDALVSATVSKVGDDIQVEYRLFSIARQQVVGQARAVKVSSRTSPRVLSHTISNAILMDQRGLRGVAMTKIAFTSDRNREPLIGTIEKREAKEIYMMDYDGANDQRLTVTRNLNINPSWAPDAKSIAYTSFSLNRVDVVISRFREGLLLRPTKGVGNNYLPAMSPDGSKIAFTSDRNGKDMDIFIANVDGSNLRRVTNNPAEDSVPTWSPSGEQIAFTSDRSGSPQVYAMNIDGTGVRLISNGGESEADRATWSPAPFNDIAVSAKHGSWYDIKIYDLASGKSRWLTDNSQGGSNESPAFSPTGRHLAFASTRTGSKQIWVVGRDGQGLRQLTRTGNNQTPTWSN